MDIDEIEASLRLNALPSLSPKRYQTLLSAYKKAKTAVEIGPSAWKCLDGLTEKGFLAIKEAWNKAGEIAKRELQFIDKEGVRVELWQGEGYPTRLRNISAAPPIIYIWGKGGTWDVPAVAVVGSRRCSYYGEQVAKSIGSHLASYGIVTISGMARGIDSQVHTSTIKAGGKTWAVLGSGFHHLYPPENKKLAEAIRENGWLISEFPLDTTPFPPNFPRRNRIISGLSSITIVVEGTEKSGSLITAKLAAEQGRDVFAVPGPIHSPLSRAPHILIQNGAKLVGSIDDITDEIEMGTKIKSVQKTSNRSSESDDSNGEYKEILEKVGSTPIPKEVLAEKLHKTPGELSPTLMTLELLGQIKCLPGGFVVRKN